MNSKNKGNAFERKVCKDLSLWWSKGEDDNVFYRSASSGARFTIRKKQDKSNVNQHGDISSISDSGMLFTKSIYVECKHYKDVDLWSIFTGKTSSPCIQYWSEDTISKANKEEMCSLIIVKQNNKPTLAIVDCTLGDFIFEYSIGEPIIRITKNKEDYYIVLFDEFLKFDSDLIRKWLRHEI